MTVLASPAVVSAAVSSTFEYLYATLHAPALARVRRRVGSHEAAEDVMQDAWRKVFSALPDYLGRPAFNGPGLVYTTADRLALDHLRRGQSAKAGGRVRFASLELPDGDLSPEAEAAGVAAETPEAAVVDAERAAAAGGWAALLLELLPRRNRNALWLHEWRGFPYERAAAEMRTTVPALKSLLLRTRRLQARLWDRERGLRAAGSGLEVRFWRNVVGGRAAPCGACWEWQGARGAGGRPQLAFRAAALGVHRTLLAPRVGWALVRGVLPPWACLSPGPGCGKRCVNPWHLRTTAKRPVAAGGPGGAYAEADPGADAPAAPGRGLSAVFVAGEALRHRREALRLTAGEVAGRAGVHPSTIHDAESERSVLPVLRAAIVAVLAAAEREGGADAPAGRRAHLVGRLTPAPPGLRLRSRRGALGLSFDAMRAASGVSRSSVQRAEQGVAVRPGTTARLAAALDRLERERAEESAA